MSREIFIKWKNTEVCFDFWCPECDAQSHYDGYGAYQYRCPQCGFIFALGDRVVVTSGNEDEPAVSGELVDY